MPRRTDVEILVDILSTLDNQRASRDRLAKLLAWDGAKLGRVIDRALNDSTRPVQIGSGGVVKYRGSERGKTVGIYNDVRRVIEHHWSQKMGLRRATVTVTARSGKRGNGVWLHPDLVMSAFPPRRRHVTDPPDLHSIEVETYSGFDIRSVYQAHAQGYGADFRWVFFATAPKVNPPKKRLLRTAQELGVGMVEFDRASASGTYKTHFAAERLNPTPEERELFCSTVGVLLDAYDR